MRSILIMVDTQRKAKEWGPLASLFRSNLGTDVYLCEDNLEEIDSLLTRSETARPKNLEVCGKLMGQPIFS